MSENNSKQGLNRRQFLKTSAAMAALVAVGISCSAARFQGSCVTPKQRR